MADLGFTVWDLLAEMGITLNIPPLLDGKQLASEEIQRGRQIASLCIHVERTMGCTKNHAILKGTFPNTI